MSFKEYEEKQYNNELTRKIISRINTNRSEIVLVMQSAYDAKLRQYAYKCYDVMVNAIQQLEKLDKELTN